MIKEIGKQFRRNRTTKWGPVNRYTIDLYIYDKECLKVPGLNKIASLVNKNCKKQLCKKDY